MQLGEVLNPDITKGAKAGEGAGMKGGRAEFISLWLLWIAGLVHLLEHMGDFWSEPFPEYRSFIECAYIM